MQEVGSRCGGGVNRENTVCHISLKLFCPQLFSWSRKNEETKNQFRDTKNAVSLQYHVPISPLRRFVLVYFCGRQPRESIMITHCFLNLVLRGTLVHNISLVPAKRSVSMTSKEDIELMRNCTSKVT